MTRQPSKKWSKTFRNDAPVQNPDQPDEFLVTTMRPPAGHTTMIVEFKRSFTGMETFRPNCRVYDGETLIGEGEFAYEDDNNVIQDCRADCHATENHSLRVVYSRDRGDRNGTSSVDVRIWY